MKGNKLFRRTRWNFNLKSHWQLGSQRAWKFVPYLKYAPGLPALIVCIKTQYYFLTYFVELVSFACVCWCLTLVSSLHMLENCLHSFIQQISFECLPWARHYTVCVNLYQGNFFVTQYIYSLERLQDFLVYLCIIASYKEFLQQLCQRNCYLLQYGGVPYTAFCTTVNTIERFQCI